MGMKLHYKLAIIGSLAVATAGGIIEATEQRGHYSGQTQLEERMEAMQGEIRGAKERTVTTYEYTAEHINNGVLALRYDNTGNKEDIAFAVGAITAVCGGLYFMSKMTRK